MQASSKWHILLQDLRYLISVPLILYLSLILFCFTDPTSTFLAVIKMLVGIFIFGLGGIILMTKFNISPLTAVSLPPRLSFDIVLRIAFFLLGGVVVCVAGMTANNWWSGFAPDAGVKQLSQATRGIMPFMFLLIFVHAAGEELFFRGFLFNYLKSFFPKRTSILISSILFVAAHLPGNPGRALLLFYSCLAMTLVYEYFGSLLYAVIVHYAINMTGFSYRWYFKDFRIEPRSILFLFIEGVMTLLVWYVGYQISPKNCLPVKKLCT